MPEQVVIEFISDTSQLQPAEDKLVALGKIDGQSAAIFKATNDQLKQRNSILDQVKQGSIMVGAEVTKEQAIYNKLVGSLKNLSGESKTAVQNLLKLSSADVAKTFTDGSKSVDDYIASLENVTPATDNLGKAASSIKQQLRAVTNELAALTLAGETEGKEFADLALKAGKLKNALQDTQQTVGNLGSDVPVIKVFAAAVQGITGAFTLATGASALFGDDNKELQEVLVKVNAVMAINAGLSETLNVLRDEAAISTARVLIAEKLNNAQIAIENGLQSESIIVRTGATVAQYALNLAMSLNPIGLVVIALATFITAIAIYTSNATKAAKAQAELNAVLSSTGDILDAGIEGINNANKKILSGLEERNARQSELDAQNLIALRANNKDRLAAITQLNAIILKNQGSTNKDTQELVQKSKDQLIGIEKDYQSGLTDIQVAENTHRKQLLVESLEDQANSLQARLSLSVKNSDQQFALQRQLAIANSALEIQAAGDDAKKVLAIRSQLARDLKDIDIAQAAEAQKQIAAALQSALIKAQNESRAINDRQSQAEVDAQKKIILEQADFDVKQEGLKAAEKKEIRDKANQQALELQRAFDSQSAQDAIQDQISANNKVLADVKLGEKDKLNLRIDNIILAAAAEIEQNRGKIAKIKEIEAKRDADIKAARLASIEDTLAKELALQEAQQASAVRAIEDQLAIQDKIANNNGIFSNKALNAQKLSLQQQIALIDQLTAYKLDSDQKALDALDKEYADGLITQEDYNVKSAQLIDKSAKDFEDGEKRKTDTALKEAEKRKRENEELLAGILSGASQAVGILQTIYSQQNDAAQNAIDTQRQHIQDLADAGEITAKEASARNKKLDIEEKQLQYQKAKRDKEIAIFNAIINTAQAVTAALTIPGVGPILAAIAGALGAAEIAVIASRPLPKFGTGKKGNYEGFAEVGETGPELISRGGRMQLAEKSTITWLGASDKVFNPKETAAMIEARIPSNYYPGMAPASAKQESFDYDRLGKTIGDNIPREGIGFDEHGMFKWVQNKNSFIKYLNQRRKWR